VGIRWLANYKDYGGSQHPTEVLSLVLRCEKVGPYEPRRVESRDGPCYSRNSS
jgi:hypothetical protein